MTVDVGHVWRPLHHLRGLRFRSSDTIMTRMTIINYGTRVRRVMQQAAIRRADDGVLNVSPDGSQREVAKALPNATVLQQ